MFDYENKVYIAIDLKSFYASVECRERNLNPLTTNLVVADNSRTEKTICLAVSPALKSYGIPGRARLFEVVSKVKEANAIRLKQNRIKEFSGKSFDDLELKKNPKLEIDYLVAVPQMAVYMKYSSMIYDVYLKYFSEEDIYVYSIDEVFIEITHYLKTYNMTPRELVTKVIQDVYEKTGITATAGIGTNLYLCKVAMDIVAKHVKGDKNGVRIAGLDELTYRKMLWDHRPLTDFWRVGKGYAKKLEAHRMFTMGDIALCSINNEDLLYKLFGVNAELLIDHSWGFENATMESIKNYKPTSNSVGSGQVLHCPYDFEKTKLIVKEMAELLSLDLVKKNLVTSKIVLTVGYDIDNLKFQDIKDKYDGEITIDYYGRKVPKHAHGTINIESRTSSTKIIVDKTEELYTKIVNPNLLIRRINLVADNVIDRAESEKLDKYEQIDLFIDYNEIEEKRKKENAENKIQKTMIELKDKYGKNAIVKGMNLQEGGTTIERNNQIGGHKA